MNEIEYYQHWYLCEQDKCMRAARVYRAMGFNWEVHFFVKRAREINRIIRVPGMFHPQDWRVQ